MAAEAKDTPPLPSTNPASPPVNTAAEAFCADQLRRAGADDGVEVTSPDEGQNPAVRLSAEDQRRIDHALARDTHEFLGGEGSMELLQALRSEVVGVKRSIDFLKQTVGNIEPQTS